MSKQSGNYPDWVLKYKEKGTFVNKTTSKDGTVSYYLYRGHSEREKGTRKVKWIVDGCIGRITEKDGLIPARHRLPEKAPAMEFGRSRICVHFTEYILPGLHRTYGDSAEKIYVAAALSYIFNTWSYGLYKCSWLHVRFPDAISEGDEGALPPEGIRRARAMIGHIMESRLGEGLADAMAFCSTVCLVGTKGSLSCTLIPDLVLEISEKHGIAWEETLWKR